MIGAVNLKPGDLILVKADAFKGRRKIKDRWEEDTWQVVHQIMTDVPSYVVTNQNGKSQVLHRYRLLIAAEVSVPLCIGIHHAWDRCTGGHAMTYQKSFPGGLMGSYNFCCGHPLEHPQKMGEDLR